MHGRMTIAKQNVADETNLAEMPGSCTQWRVLACLPLLAQVPLGRIPKVQRSAAQITPFPVRDMI